MILSYTVRRFFAPDDGASASNGQAGDQQQQQPSDPFSKIDLDNLDADTRAVIEASKTTFALLQKDVAEAKASADKNQKLAQKFQSDHDRTVAELNRIKGPAQVDPQAAKLTAVEKVLLDRGISPEQAKAQAPIFADMFGIFATELKGEIGRDLAPFGATVMQNEAHRSWQQAESMDKLAALQIPEVRQKTWEGVQQLLQSNQPVTAATVLNLRNIYYAEHKENDNTNGQPPMNQFNQPPPMPSFGGTFYGGGSSPQRPPQQQQNQLKHQGNADTTAAIAKIAALWKAQLPSKGGK